MSENSTALAALLQQLPDSMPTRPEGHSKALGSAAMVITNTTGMPLGVIELNQYKDGTAYKVGVTVYSNESEDTAFGRLLRLKTQAEALCAQAEGWMKGKKQKGEE